ncbi:hypothetical protein BCON_0429g00020 [Botryotinia convoluta]|uniref:Uncharacterized protein n=1 Tax=Botryotinia convoluta TaxID=54673 RepID=A0A4Z1H7K1_9HELO|nr:hypothetical protein BCON_0429g00020 [Botryotinia convoluta]
MCNVFCLFNETPDLDDLAFDRSESKKNEILRVGLGLMKGCRVVWLYGDGLLVRQRIPESQNPRPAGKKE